MELKPGYKQTAVGVIPEEWDAKAIGDEIDLLTGFPFPSNGYSKYGVRLLRGSNVKRGTTDWADDLTQYWPRITQDTKRYELNVGDIVIAMDGSLVGRSSARLKEEDLPALLLQRVARIRSSKIDLGYLNQFVAGDRFASHCDSVKTVTAIPHISPDDIRNFVIPVPPTTHEQDRIANALSDVDTLISSLDQLIAKKRDIKQATMQQLLTGKQRLPGFCAASGKPGYKQTEVGVIPDDWDIDFVVNLAAITTGDKNTQDRIEDGAYPFFVRSSTVERINSYTFDGEAVLTAGDGVGTGKIFHYVNGKFDFHQRVYSISNFCEHLDGYFFYLYFSNNFFSRIMQMTAKSSVDSVRREMIANMRIPVPPLAEQKAIATVIADMDAEITTLAERRDKTLAIKQGMMQDLLTGRIRLV